MASLRTAVVQTYCVGNCCLNILSSLSSLLQANYDDHPAQERPSCSSLQASVSDSFRQIELSLLIDKNRSTWIDSFYQPSLLRIEDNASADFSTAQHSDGSFVHVLELTASAGG
jgi:hypothetical protein